LFLVVLVGIAVRVYGLRWGLPYHFHSDERVLIFFTEALRTAPSVDAVTANHRFFLYPPLPMYLLLGLLRVMSWVHPLSVTEPDGITAYYLLARAISAGFGSATLGLVYVLGARLYSRPIGALGAAFLAVCVLHVRDSHFFTSDVPFAFFVVATVLAAAAIAGGGGPGSYVLAGLGLGAGLATKQTTLMVVPALVTAHLVALAGHREWTDRLSPRRWAPLALALAVAAGSFVALDPFVVLAPKQFLAMQRETWELVSGLNQPHYTFQFTGTTLGYWFTNLLYFGMGPFLEAAAVLGVLWAAVRRRAGDLLLLSFVLPYLYWVGGGYMKFVRYAVPLLPFLCLLGARALLDLGERAAVPHARLTLRAATAVVLAGSFLYVLAYLNVYHRTDVRLQASRWIHRAVPPGSPVLIDSSGSTPLFGPAFLHPDLSGSYLRHSSRDEEYYAAKALSLVTDSHRPRLSRQWWDGYLTERLAGVDFIFMSDEYPEQYSHRPEANPALIRFYDNLFAGRLGFRLIKTFAVYPSLLGYRLNDDRAELTFRLFDHPKVFIFQREPIVVAEAPRS
jgi:4-amino-4-deoxy-L-arabinose transferase-like glycosyltransferase